MQHFIFFFWILLALTPLIIFMHQTNIFKKKFIYHSLTNLLINQPFFSTLIVQQLTSYISKQPSSRKKLLLDYIFKQNTSSLLKNLKDSSLHYQLSLIVSQTIPIPKCNQPLLILLCAQKLIHKKLYTKAQNLLKRLNENPHSRKLAAVKLLLDAKIIFHEGDLLNSSAWCIQAVNLFKKQKLLYEEAETYLLLGQIYQAGKFFDSAEFILRNALKIFKHLKCHRGMTKCYCFIGSLTAAQERWEEARSFFDDAINHADLSADKQLFYWASCYMAMLDVALNNPHHALAQITDFDTNECDSELIAFHNDVMAQAHFYLNHWHKASHHAKLAQKFYIATNNHQASSEVSKIIEKSSHTSKNHKIS